MVEVLAFMLSTEKPKGATERWKVEEAGSPCGRTSWTMVMSSGHPAQAVGLRPPQPPLIGLF